MSTGHRRAITVAERGEVDTGSESTAGGVATLALANDRSLRAYARGDTAFVTVAAEGGVELELVDLVEDTALFFGVDMAVRLGGGNHGAQQ